MTPPDPEISDLVACLDKDRRELFEERAAIREFDGGLLRERAECLALLDVLRLHPMAFTGLTALRVCQGDTTRFALTANLASAIAQFSAQGLAVEAIDLLRLVLELGGTAELVRPV